MLYEIIIVLDTVVVVFFINKTLSEPMKTFVEQELNAGRCDIQYS